MKNSLSILFLGLVLLASVGFSDDAASKDAAQVDTSVTPVVAPVAVATPDSVVAPTAPSVPDVPTSAPVAQ